MVYSNVRLVVNSHISCHWLPVVGLTSSWRRRDLRKYRPTTPSPNQTFSTYILYQLLSTWRLLAILAFGWSGTVLQSTWWPVIWVYTVQTQSHQTVLYLPNFSCSLIYRMHSAILPKSTFTLFLHLWVSFSADRSFVRKSSNSFSNPKVRALIVSLRRDAGYLPCQILDTDGVT